MMEGKNTMSVRRALLLYMTITFPLAQRIIPIYSAREGKQAGWLSPVISAVFLIMLVLIVNRLYKNFDGMSLMDIVYGITGKVIGKIICGLWALWVLIELCKFVRYFAERTVSTIMTGPEIHILIGLILVTVAICLYSSIIVLCRMNEIVFPLIILTFFGFALMLVPNINISYLTPISYLDIIPVFKASIGTTGIWAYYLIIFFISDGFTNKKYLKAESIKAVLFLSVITIILNIIIIGVFDYSVVERLPSPYLASIKDMSVFNTFQKAEPIAVALWVIEDFILFSVFAYAFLSILKSLLSLSDVKFLIMPMLIFVYFFSLFIAESRFELENFSNIIAIPTNIILFIILPVILLIIGKIRKKI
ncbi:MAG: GerAB/ArcD/ProY family transporter [Syntrophomonadaceae bacterium]|nr:GerAB/ArcD/ProY family transporter [Syntrophomonadaceae bacterium]